MTTEEKIAEKTAQIRNYLAGKTDSGEQFYDTYKQMHDELSVLKKEYEWEKFSKAIAKVNEKEEAQREIIRMIVQIGWDEDLFKADGKINKTKVKKFPQLVAYLEAQNFYVFRRKSFRERILCVNNFEIRLTIWTEGNQVPCKTYEEYLAANSIPAEKTDAKKAYKQLLKIEKECEDFRKKAEEFSEKLKGLGLYRLENIKLVSRWVDNIYYYSKA